MDADSRMILRMMEANRKEAKQDLAELEARLSKKIDVLWAFRFKILGGSSLTSGVVTVLFHWLTKAK